MDDIKPWHIVLIVAAIGVLGFSVFKFGLGKSDESLMADSITMVDAESGQLFSFSLKGRRGVMVPGKNPDTGKYTLMPVSKTDAGDWVVGRRDLQAIGYVEGSVSSIDRSTGVVTTNGESPIAVRN